MGRVTPRYNADVSTSFLAKLDAAVAENRSLVCVGLDPDPALMPIKDPIEFCQRIIDSTADLVCAYKPNMAFFEAMGERGWEVLRETLAAIPPEIPVICDAKRGDIGNTSAAYAQAIFELLNCDAATVNPYGGTDAVEPFLEYRDKGVIVWCRSSNPSAREFQDLMVSDNGTQRPFWQTVALKAREWDAKYGNVALVMGATYPEQLKQAREICPEMPFLVPGIGSQEGALEDAVKAGLNSKREGIIVNASRSILYASRGEDYALAARAAAAQLREHINRYRDELPVPVEAMGSFPPDDDDSED
jgi:orotidine-5'-phosphate decarboxylase